MEKRVFAKGNTMAIRQKFHGMRLFNRIFDSSDYHIRPILNCHLERPGCR